jgi:hypothetical protein
MKIIWQLIKHTFTRHIRDDRVIKKFYNHNKKKLSDRTFLSFNSQLKLANNTFRIVKILIFLKN